MAGKAQVAALAVALCLATAGCAQLGLGAPSYDEELSIPGTTDDIPAQQVALADGSELVVGYVGDGEFAAQWRDPEGEGWTAPETLVDGGDLVPSLIGVADEDATAVVRFSWYPEGDDEREEYDRVDAVVCREASCEVVEGGGTPLLAEDGEHVVAVRSADTLDVDPTGPAPAYEVATWSAGDWLPGWDEETVDGPPLEMSAFLRPPLVLTDDGRLATVRAVEDGGCSYELWVGEPRSTELTAAATTPVVGEEDCTIQDVTAEDEAVSFTAQSTDDTVTFSRTDDGWSDDVP